MKILFSVGSFERGGKQGRLIALAQHLVRQGFELAVIANGESPNLPLIAPLCKKVYGYEAGKATRNLLEHKRAVNDFNPHIIHSWSGSCTALAVLASIGTKCRVVTSEVTNAQPLKTLSAGNLLARFNFALADIVFSNSMAGLEAKKVPKRKGRVIYNGYSLDRLKGLNDERYAEWKSPDQFKAIMAARFFREKDYTTMLKLASLAQQEKANIVFLLAGEGPDMDSMMSEAHNAQLANVRFLGHVEDIDNLLPRVNVGVLATDPRFHQEGISNSVMEYMAHGKPVIITDGVAAGEIVSAGYNGFITKARDPFDILEKLRLLQSDPELVKEMGRNARTTVLKKFDLEKMGTEFVNAYRNLVLANHLPVNEV